jgi:hypothetical protein
MTSTNGSKSPIEQAFALLDALDPDECARVKAKIVALEHERLVREIEKQKALDRELNRKRSLMSAREKSEFLEAKKAAGMSGAEAQRAYFEIPWS